MKTILDKYVGSEIGINIERHFKLEAVTLESVGDTFFTVVDHGKGYTHHLSMSSIVQIIEAGSGIEMGGLFSQRKHFDVVVRLGHLYEYVPA